VRNDARKKKCVTARHKSVTLRPGGAGSFLDFLDQPRAVTLAQLIAVAETCTSAESIS
jgi:hypothetical protein